MIESEASSIVPADTRISFLAMLGYLLAASLLIALCGGAVVIGKQLLFGPAPPLAPGAAWPLSVWVAYVALALAVLAAYGLQGRLVEHRPRRELALDRAPGELLLGAATGIALAFSIVLLLWVTGCYRIAGWRGPADLAAPTLMAIGAGLMEEILVRGFVLGLIQRWGGSVLALVLSSILFGGLHIANPGAGLWPVAALSLGAGMALAAATLATGRLWLPIGLHFGWNFGQSGLFGLSDSGTSFPSLIDARVTGPAWLTGGAFGPEASLPGLAIWVLFGSFLLARAVRSGRIVPWRPSPVLEVSC